MVTKKSNNDLVNYAKKAIMAAKEIYERDTRIENLRNIVRLSRYDEQLGESNSIKVLKINKQHSIQTII